MKHARQAVGHPKWIREHVKLREEPIVVCVMITPAKPIHPEAATFAEDVKYWQIEEFRTWAKEAVAIVREVRKEYPGPGSLGWRVAVCETLRRAKLDPMSILEQMVKIDIAALPKVGGKVGEAATE